MVKVIKAGLKVTGRYKRGGRSSQDTSIVVDRCFQVPDGFGNDTPYVVGAYAAGPRTGTVTALRADCFDPRTLELVEIPDYTPLPTDGATWYLTQGSGAFGFTERVPDEDIGWAEAHGGVPLSRYECDSLPVPGIIVAG